MTYKTSEYDKFKVFEPKEREIFRLPYYPDRIAHHAIMNILEPIWIRVFTRDTYSSIKGRGIHSLVKKLKKDLKENPEETKYCLKLDIKKFYPSIDHEKLKKILRKKLKDSCLLWLLDEIVDSVEGVPIGNYLSQYFANLFLAYFDHIIKEVLKVKFYYRYADDIVILSSNKEFLHMILREVKKLLEELSLELKSNYQVFPVESRGIDFVGYVFFHTHVLLRKSMKIKMWKLVYSYINGEISERDFLIRMQSYVGWLKWCNSKNLLRKIETLTGFRFSNWDGEMVNVSNFIRKNIYIVEVIRRNKYNEIHFVYKGKSFRTRSKRLPCLKHVKLY